MERKLFCKLSPWTYQISVEKERLLRRLEDTVHRCRFACEKQQELLPEVICRHKSLIRRRLGNVDMQLQENKAVNLTLTAPKIDRVLIRPGQTFSFWHLAGHCTAKKGYREGLAISNGQAIKGIGGGMCQFTNLLYWMVLHSDLTVTERHHHDQFDLFPDFNRQIPFGTGTSIFYNYLDFRFRNDTDRTYQLATWTDGTYLCGELRADFPQDRSYHIESRGEFFSLEEDGCWRNGEVYRRIIDKRTGNLIREELLQKNHAKLQYDASGLELVDLRKNAEKRQ